MSNELRASEHDHSDFTRVSSIRLLGGRITLSATGYHRCWQERDHAESSCELSGANLTAACGRL